MKRSVKIISLFVSVVMLLNLCGCTITIGGGSEKTTAETTADTAASTAKPTAKKTAAKKTKAPTAKAAAKPQHQHTYYEEIVEGTCKKQGYSVFTCSCGDSYKANYVNGDHQYKDYVCTVCGAIDKEHAYEYLREWLKDNGERNGQSIGLTLNDDLGEAQTMTHLMYQVDTDVVVASIYWQQRGHVFFFAVRLDNYEYGGQWDNYQYFVEGVLPAEDFTDNYPLPYSNITVNRQSKQSFLETMRILASQTIIDMEVILIENNVGITVADLGFTSYDT